MKKIILSIFFISLLSLTYAQKFNGGVMIGMAASQVAGDTYSGFNKVGPIGGFFVNLQPTHRSSFQAEIYYVQKGSRKSADYAVDDYESYLLRLNYVELPILYQYHIGWFHIEAGPSVAFLMSGYEEADGVENTLNDFSKATFQLNLGVVFTVAKNWKLGIRTNNSFTNLRTDTHTGQVSRLWTHGQFNDVMMFTLAYQFFHF